MLLKCTDCNHDVNTEAKACPNCGAIKPFKNQKLTQEQVKGMSFSEMSQYQKLGGKIEMGKGQKIFWGVIVLIIAIAIFSPSAPKTAEELAVEAQQKVEADLRNKNSALEFECTYAIKQSLNDPDSVDFGAVVVIPMKDDKYSIIQDLRAKNAFGAMMKASFECIVSYDGKNATLIDMKQLGQ